MKVALVAQDIAPSLAFEMLTAELTSRGHEAKLLVGKGKVFPVTLDEVRKVVREADIVVVGMSSSAKLAGPEIAACEEAVSQKQKIPLGFYGDTYHCHERARADCWFGPYRRHADFFLAINQSEADSARNVLVKPTLISVATGNPTWEDYFFPKYTRAEVRSKYHIADDEILVLAPGGKSPVVNILLNGLLVEAMTGWDRKSKIFIAYHPGDRTPYAVDPDKENSLLNIYSDLKVFSPVPVEFLPNDVKTSDVLPGADIVVEWGSSLAIEAAHQRIPVISVSTEIGRKKVFSTTKSEKLKVRELGVVVWVSCSSAEIKQAMIDLILLPKIDFLHSVAIDNLCKRQAEVYPKPQAKGSAVKKMADTLESIVKK